MADLDITVRGSSVPPYTESPSVSVDSHESTAAGDYLLVVAAVDYVAAATNPGISAATGVGTWVEMAAAADPASGTTVETIRAWLGPVTTGGPRTVTVTQTGASGLHAIVTTLAVASNGDGVIARDGTAAAIVDRATPYVHTTITPTGTKGLLVVAHAAVQFTATDLAYGAAPAGMTAVDADATHIYSCMQMAYQTLTSAAATGTRSQTSNVATVTGGAGIRFLLRAQGTVPSSGPEPGRLLLAV